MEHYRQEVEPMLMRRPVTIVALGCFLSLIAVIALAVISADWSQPAVIASDPARYGAIASEILAGGLPYIDVTVEHLPILLLPILAVGLLADATSMSFSALWVTVTIGVIVGTVAAAGRIRISDDYQRRLALVMLPMLPLIIFRLEIYVVTLAIVAIGALGVGRYRVAGLWTLLGILAKGWPVALTVVPLRKGHRLIALSTVTAGTVLLATVATLPGFRQGRSFAGIHTETIIGNLLLVIRHLTGADLDLIGTAGATYVTAPSGAIILNASIAVPFLVIGLRVLFRTRDMATLVSVAGLTTAVIILLSPLFSAQFTFWLVPFVVLTAPRTRSAYVAAAALSTMVVAFWNPVEAWWAFEVLVRNVAFIALIVLWAGELYSSTTAHGDDNTSRRNLPV